jgi:hypothetical protein
LCGRGEEIDAWRGGERTERRGEEREERRGEEKRERRGEEREDRRGEERRGLVKLTMCSAVGLDERYKNKNKQRWKTWQSCMRLLRASTRPTLNRRFLLRQTV